MNFYSRFSGTMGTGHASLLNAAVCLELSNSTAPGDNCLSWAKKTNIIIEGGGTINGQGAEWWANCNPTCPDVRVPTICLAFHHNQQGSNTNQRPTLLGLLWVNGLTIDNVALQDSPCWTVHPTFCENVLISNLNITAPASSHNTDGVIAMLVISIPHHCRHRSRQLHWRVHLALLHLDWR
jgi:polygalacturonase